MPESKASGYALDPRMWSITPTFHMVFVLSELLKQPCHGYELFKPYQLRSATIYGILRRLAKEEVVMERLVISEKGAPRKLYYLTEFGYHFAGEAVKQWNSDQALKENEKMRRRAETLS